MARQLSGRPPEANRRSGDDLPAYGGDFNRSPVAVCKIEVERAIVLGDAQVHQPFGAIELALRLQLFNRPVDD